MRLIRSTVPADRRDRMTAFLALSLLLHALLLVLVSRNHSPHHPGSDATSLAVRLTGAAKPRAALPLHSHQEVSASPPASDQGQPIPVGDKPAHATSTAEPGSPGINLDAAFAAARSIGKEATVSRQPGGLATQRPSVESAIAKAFVSDEIVETRGAGGEWVFETAHSRCVAPIRVPDFLKGITLMPLCTRK